MDAREATQCDCSVLLCRFDGIIVLTRRLSGKFADPRDAHLLVHGVLSSLFPQWLLPAFRVSFVPQLLHGSEITSCHPPSGSVLNSVCPPCTLARPCFQKRVCHQCVLLTQEYCDREVVLSWLAGNVCAAIPEVSVLPGSYLPPVPIMTKTDATSFRHDCSTLTHVHLAPNMSCCPVQVADRQVACFSVPPQ